MPGLFERFVRAAPGPLMPRTAPGEAGPADPMETRAGGRLVHGTGADHEVLRVDRASVPAAIRAIDRDNGFCRVFAAVRPGVWLEVGGSLDPDHGLPAPQVDRGRRIGLVIGTPPETAADMEAMMPRFLESEDALPAACDVSGHRAAPAAG